MEIRLVEGQADLIEKEKGLAERSVYLSVRGVQDESHKEGGLG